MRMSVEWPAVLRLRETKLCTCQEEASGRKCQVSSWSKTQGPSLQKVKDQLYTSPTHREHLLHRKFLAGTFSWASLDMNLPEKQPSLYSSHWPFPAWPQPMISHNLLFIFIFLFIKRVLIYLWTNLCVHLYVYRGTCQLFLQ